MLCYHSKCIWFIVFLKKFNIRNISIILMAFFFGVPTYFWLAQFTIWSCRFFNVFLVWIYVTSLNKNNRNECYFLYAFDFAAGKLNAVRFWYWNMGMLSTTGLKALVKKFKEEILSWNWCIQPIKTLKNIFFYIKLSNYFYFRILNKCPQDTWNSILLIPLSSLIPLQANIKITN